MLFKNNFNKTRTLKKFIRFLKISDLSAIYLDENSHRLSTCLICQRTVFYFEKLDPKN